MFTAQADGIVPVIFPLSPSRSPSHRKKNFVGEEREVIVVRNGAIYQWLVETALEINTPKPPPSAITTALGKLMLMSIASPHPPKLFIIFLLPSIGKTRKCSHRHP